MMFGLIFCFALILFELPENVNFGDALYLAGSVNKLTALDLEFDLSEKYNVWSGVFAALFLMLSYFGTDQTQVQRYLTTSSLKDAQKSLLLSAYAKVPMQFFILFLGVMLYVFFIFQPTPISFRNTDTTAQTQEQIDEELEISQEYQTALKLREETALMAVSTRNSETKSAFVKADEMLNQARNKELALQAEITQTDVNDTNYIFPYFILKHIPIGLVGLIVAGIFAAAMSSIDSELNALTTVSIVDWYQRLGLNKQSEVHYLNSSRVATLLWGLIATGSAMVLGETKSIIELINQIGSYFYGSILGVFILLLWVKRANGRGALTGLLTGMLSVFTFDRLFYNASTNDYSFFLPWTQVPDSYSKAIEFLWLNPLGTFVVVVIGITVSLVWNKKS